MKIYVAMIVMLTFACLTLSLIFIQSLEQQEDGTSRDLEGGLEIKK